MISVVWSHPRTGRPARRRLIAALAVAVALVAGTGVAGGASSVRAAAGPPGAAGAPGARLAGCRVLPADNPFNQRVDRLPVARDSAPLIARIGLDASVHPDFGTVYAGRTERHPDHRRVRSRDPPARFASPMPRSQTVPATRCPVASAIEGGPHGRGDRHVIVLDRSTCTDYELYAAYPHAGYWTAGSGAIFPLNSDRLRPAGWTSADAAGLPILPGLARYAEVAGGAIDHALRFTAPCTGPRYVYPARHDAATCGGASAPPMGLRVRLKAAVNISRLPRQARIVATALKRYGMILADNGSPWYISGAPDRRWNDARAAPARRADRPRLRGRRHPHAAAPRPRRPPVGHAGHTGHPAHRPHRPHRPRRLRRVNRVSRLAGETTPETPACLPTEFRGSSGPRRAT